jgi:hypothetical protein
MGQNVFEMRDSGVLLYRMEGDYYERDFTSAGSKNQKSHADFGVETSIGDSSGSNTYIGRDFMLAHMHAYCARRVNIAAPFVTIVREDQLKDEIEVIGRTLNAYGIAHKTFVGRQHTDEAAAYFARRSRPADVRAIAAHAEKAAAQAISDAAAQRGVKLWRPGGLLLQRTALASMVNLWEEFFDSPRDAVLLDLRRCTLNLTSDQLANCFDVVEFGMGKIAAPMAAIVRTEDVRIMQGSVDLASKAGRFFGVFTGHDSDKAALDWLAEMNLVMPPSAPQIAAWGSYTTRVLTKAKAAARQRR